MNADPTGWDKSGCERLPVASHLGAGWASRSWGNFLWMGMLDFLPGMTSQIPNQKPSIMVLVMQSHIILRLNCMMTPSYYFPRSTFFHWLLSFNFIFSYFSMFFISCPHQVSHEWWCSPRPRAVPAHRATALCHGTPWCGWRVDEFLSGLWLGSRVFSTVLNLGFRSLFAFLCCNPRV